MIKTDSPIEMNDLPHLQAEKRKTPDAGQEPVFEEQSRSKSAIWPAIIVLILCIVGVSYWNNLLTNQLHEQKQQTQNALDRIAAMENRLSSTDETMSQSSITVQVRLKELKQRSDELWNQMDKLWASAWRRNQKDLTDQGKSIEKLKKTHTTIDADQQKQRQSIKNLQGEITAIEAKIEELGFLNKAITKNGKTLSSMNNTVSKLQSTLQKLQKMVDDNSGWVESNLTFRKKTNQTLDRVDRRIQNLEPVAR